MISERWDYNFGLHRNMGGKAAKVGTFNKFLEDAGHGDKVQYEPEISAAADFGNDPLDYAPEKLSKKTQQQKAERDAKRAKRDGLRRVRAIRIVRSLLDKTVANGCTMEEAASSQAKAAEIIAQYKLTTEELTADLPPDSAEEEAAAEFKDVPQGATEAEFFCHSPTNTYIFAPTHDYWPAGSINTLFNKGATRRIAVNRGVQQATWAPGLPMIVRDKLISNGTWIDKPGASVFNLYKPPMIVKTGDAKLAGPWIDHLKTIYPDDWQHILGWFAWRVQRPDVKINHCIVMGGDPGIGKDTLIAGLRHAVGPWNCSECNPPDLFKDFNASILQAVIVRVNEARDMGEGRVDRFQFYEGTKTFMASPPETLPVEQKYLKKYFIMNLLGMLITTNNKMNGLYLPHDDRRHYVAWSRLTEADFTTEKQTTADYFKELWAWYEGGGFDHVAAFLRSYDLAAFDPKASPPKTPVFWEIVGANRASQDSELAALLADMGNPFDLPGVHLPEAITVDQVAAAAARDLENFNDLYEWLSDRKSRRQVPGKWRVAGKRQTVYTLKSLSGRDAFKAVAAMQKQAERLAARAKITRAKADKQSDKSGRNALAD